MLGSGQGLRGLCVVSCIADMLRACGSSYTGVSVNRGSFVGFRAPLNKAV